MQTLLNELTRIITFVWSALLHIWPLLMVSIPIAVIIKELDISKAIGRIFGKNIWLSILLATLLGAVAPFCSCGVIPVISALLIAGVPIGPVMAFWLASPSMDPEIFFLSVGSLGWPLAVARISVTFIMSISGGIIVHLLFKNKAVAEHLRVGQKEAMGEKSCETAYGGNNHSELEAGCGCEKQAISRWQHLLGSALSATWFVLKFLLIAYVLEALIIFYVPMDTVTGIFGNSPLFSVVIASLVGIPLYTTNLSALGLMGGLLAKGLNGGAALAFLVGGATTTVPAMAAVYKLVNRKIFAVYLGVTLFFAVASGWIYYLFEALI